MNFGGFGVICNHSICIICKVLSGLSIGGGLIVESDSTNKESIWLKSSNVIELAAHMQNNAYFKFISCAIIANSGFP